MFHVSYIELSKLNVNKKLKNNILTKVRIFIMSIIIIFVILIFMKKGFTLIELLVVIAVIAVIATIVLSSLNNARDKARVSRTQIELQQISNLIFEAQTVENLAIIDITESNCSDCPCRQLEDLSVLPDTHQCVVRWRSAIDSIATVVDPDLDASLLYEDAWGSPYLLDENESEPNRSCRTDLIRSAGPDRSVGPETINNESFNPSSADRDDVNLKLFQNVGC